MNTQYYNTAYLLIGGNMGRRLEYLEQAITRIRHGCGDIVQQSPVYETAAWGNTGQGAFLNQALELHTQYKAEGLMQQLLHTEAVMGRARTERYGPRTIDIDILLFNDAVQSTPLLTVPHPEMQNRRFALQPLADIAADVQHPVFRKSIAQLLQECPDELPVRKIASSF